ncbi:MAG: serine hydrolase [Planctomycetaceae bacterium]|nr:serine hydrolase [Planctomycetaceae bacterium]
MNAILISAACLLAAPPETTWPANTWEQAEPADVGMDARLLAQARDYALTGEGSGFITRHGRLVMSWGDPKQLYDLKSSSKSIGVTALGLAITDGRMKLDDLAQQYHPAFGTPPDSNAKTGWLPKITLRHLATQTAGFEKPGGYEPLLFEPGTQWHYSDGGPNWLAECVTLVYREDIQELMFRRVFTPIGIQRTDLRWRKNSYRPAEIEGIPRREFGSGVSANVDAMARIGLLYLLSGKWQDARILDPEFVAEASTTVPAVVGLSEHDPKHGNASDHYGLLWWNNNDGTLDGVPRDAYWSWGLYDSLIFVVPSLDIVAARAGKSWNRGSEEHYDVLRGFFDPIVASVTPSEPTEAAIPYPPSPVIRDVVWAPPETILRRAEGSDNWPTTWADDDRLYTAYGDGWGFDPHVPEKLSMGFARIEDGPENPAFENIRSPSGETYGDGRKGKKASGLLMVDSILYLCARNADNAQIAWSEDHGATWQWCDWRFEESFGCPTFLNLGRNYAGARDDYVYLYSLDSDSAYDAADRFVLARVKTDRIRDRDAYQFFQRLDNSGSPQWTADVTKRGSIFDHRGRCGRSIVTYNEPLNRYLWVQVLSHGDEPEDRTGMAIFDAPEPWGPWTTAFHTETWDVPPGETAGFPSKWISADGCTAWLIFSGGDCFALRKADLLLH